MLDLEYNNACVVIVVSCLVFLVTVAKMLLVQ